MLNYNLILGNRTLVQNPWTDRFISNLSKHYGMSLHHDFPYEATYLYCKTCMAKTLHNKPIHEYTCSICCSVWDELLLQMNIKQNKYGKLSYQCILLSDKPANSPDYSTTKFDNLEESLDWFKKKAEELVETIKSRIYG